MRPRVQIRSCGLVGYAAGLAIQEAAREQVERREWDCILLLMQHLPVVTTGRGGGRENLRATPDALAGEGVEFFESGRGGNITCHNPGQVVGYPVMNLSIWQEDVHWYVRQLEAVLIGTLAHYGVVAGRKARYTGVWVGDRKIAAIGVSVRRWITGHGFALNVSNDLSLFGRIVPCGISEFGVTSLDDLGVAAEVTAVEAQLIKKFCEIFLTEHDSGERGEANGENSGFCGGGGA